ncbi:hypothetical protein OK016_29240 [Vibrio chagasii]|nr:hypothetical protein [Vibrio chagasii]
MATDGAVYIYHLTSYGDRDYAWEGVFTGDSVQWCKEEFGKSMMFKPGTDGSALSEHLDILLISSRLE